MKLRARPHFAGGIWKRSFHSEKIKCFPSTLRRTNLKTQQSTVILDLCLWKTRSGKSHDYRDADVFEKLRFQNVFRPHENEKPAFSKSSGLKSAYKMLCFRGGLVWTVGLTTEIKLPFQIFRHVGPKWILVFRRQLTDLGKCPDYSGTQIFSWCFYIHVKRGQGLSLYWIVILSPSDVVRSKVASQTRQNVQRSFYLLQNWVI